MRATSLFPRWVWVLIVVGGILALIASASMVNDCVASGKTQLECMALLNAATNDHGSVIVDTRRP